MDVAPSGFKENKVTQIASQTNQHKDVLSSKSIATSGKIKKQTNKIKKSKKNQHKYKYKYNKNKAIHKNTKKKKNTTKTVNLDVK